MNRSIEIERLTPFDYVDFNKVTQSAWPGLAKSSVQDFTAITDCGVSFGAFEQDRLIGASYNFVKPTDRFGNFHLYVHMLGVLSEEQGRGVGRRLMKANYDLVRDAELGESVLEVKLTSDPLDGQNA